MTIISIFIMAFSLAIDATCAAICKGLQMSKIKIKYVFIIALMFGFFQAGMLLIGFLIGGVLEFLVSSIDHWIAFILLSIVGGKMIYDGCKDSKSDDETEFKLNFVEIVTLSIATSIDALSVGITLAFIDVKIVMTFLVVGLVTFAMSFVGVFIGKRIGSKYNKLFTIIGGIVLIILGIKILLEHLEIISVLF